MKKLNNIKWFTLGIAACILASTLIIPASATSRNKQATLYYNDIKITLDGEPVIPQDAIGNTIEPFIIDGTTYLPVRGIANALGVIVKWNGVTSTVELTTNRFNDYIPKYRSLDINFNPVEIRYENGKLYAKMFITNGYNSTVSNINVDYLRISNSDGIIAEGSFDVLEDATIAPNGYITWTFIFSNDALMFQNADLTEFIRTDFSVSYDH